MFSFRPAFIRTLALLIVFIIVRPICYLTSHSFVTSNLLIFPIPWDETRTEPSARAGDSRPTQGFLYVFPEISGRTTQHVIPPHTPLDFSCQMEERLECSTIRSSGFGVEGYQYC
jgi:hypothetical protein